MDKSRPHPQDDETRLAMFDAMFDEPVPLTVEEHVHEPLSEYAVVNAMQELLTRHEDQQLHKVEDPELTKVLRELRTLAFSNISDVFECEDVLNYIGLDEHEQEVYHTVTRMSVRNLNELPRSITACIQSVKITRKATGDVIEVKMYDKQISLDKLMRFHGAFVKDNEQLHKDTQGGIIDLLMGSIAAKGMPTITNNEA